MVADALEALIGAFFMAGGAEETSDFLRRILLLPQARQKVPFRQPPAYQPPALGMASCAPFLLVQHLHSSQLAPVRASTLRLRLRA